MLINLGIVSNLIVAIDLLSTNKCFVIAIGIFAVGKNNPQRSRARPNNYRFTSIFFVCNCREYGCANIALCISRGKCGLILLRFVLVYIYSHDAEKYVFSKHFNRLI